MRNEPDAPRPATDRPIDESPPEAGRSAESPLLAVLPYRAPYDEPSGPTVIDIFKGLAAVGLMLLFLALALCMSVLPLEFWSNDGPSGYAIAAPAALIFLLLLGAWLSYRGARDCFTGAIRRSSVRPVNDQRPDA